MLENNYIWCKYLEISVLNVKLFLNKAETFRSNEI